MKTSYFALRALNIGLIAAMIFVAGTMWHSIVSAAPLATTAGPNFAGNASGGLVPLNATGPNDNICDQTTSPGQTIDLTNFAFNIPAQSIITGILVEPKAASFNSSVSARLLNNGLPAGDTKAWLPTSGQNCSFSNFASLGGTGDVWGTTWTPNDINSMNFGVRITVAGVSAPFVFLDAVRITILYDPPVVRPAEVPEADTLVLMAGGLGGLATWLEWQRRRIIVRKKIQNPMPTIDK